MRVDDPEACPEAVRYMCAGASRVCATQDLFSRLGVHDPLLALEKRADQNDKSQRTIESEPSFSVTPEESLLP